MADKRSPTVDRPRAEALTGDRQLRQGTLAAEARLGTIGDALARYNERLGMDRDGRATWLGLDPDRLAALALTPLPDLALARRFGVDTGRLREALR